MKNPFQNPDSKDLQQRPINSPFLNTYYSDLNAPNPAGRGAHPTPVTGPESMPRDGGRTPNPFSAVPQKPEHE